MPILTALQRCILGIYADGDYTYLIEKDVNDRLHGGPDEWELGDTLLEFFLREFSVDGALDEDSGPAHILETLDDVTKDFDVLAQAVRKALIAMLHTPPVVAVDADALSPVDLTPGPVIRATLRHDLSAPAFVSPPDKPRQTVVVTPGDGTIPAEPAVAYHVATLSAPEPDRSVVSPVSAWAHVADGDLRLLLAEQVPLTEARVAAAISVTEEALMADHDDDDVFRPVYDTREAALMCADRMLKIPNLQAALDALRIYWRN